MSPVAPSSGHAGKALLIAATAVVVIMGGLYLAAVTIGKQPATDVRLGDTTFHGGSTKRLSKAIAKGGPILYSDVSGSHDLDIVLQHVGPDRQQGWYAFAAQPKSHAGDRACVWEWQKASRTFRAACDHSLTAPADGTGLERFPVTVRNGQLDIDLNGEDVATTTTAEVATTTTTVPQSGQPKGN